MSRPAAAPPRRLGSTLATARAAARLVRRSSPRLARISLLANVLQAVLLLAQVVLAKLTLEEVVRASRTGGSVLDAVPAIVGLVAAGALGAVVTASLLQIQRMLGERVRQVTLRSLMDVTTSVELSTFESPEFFDDLQRVQDNALGRPLQMVQGTTRALAGALSVVLLCVALALLEPLLLPTLLVGVAPLLLLSRAAGRDEFRFNLEQTTAARVRGYLVRVLTGRDEAKEVRAYDLAVPLRARWEASSATYLADLIRHLRRQVAIALGGAVVTVVLTSASLAVLLGLVVSGRLSVADAGASIVAIRLLAGRVSELSGGVGQVLQSALFLEDLDRFLARGRPALAQDQPPRVLAEVTLDDVSFRYPGGHADALAGVSASLRAGEVVAVVGESGSGKSTLAKLLGGLYEPTAGTVTWREASGQVLPRAEARASIGVVFQDFVRFQLPVRDNIGLGRHDPPATDAELRGAADRAGALGFLDALPGGLDAVLGKELPGGHDLSGGQWQRIAIARAFLRDAPFLVLDEPSASLDARSEHALFDRVRELARGRGVLLISHRFSTVTSADRILVMSEGRVVEEGSHSELVAARGVYAELFELQAGAYR